MASQSMTRAEALGQPGDVRVHYKGGIYRKLFVATLTDDAKAGDQVAVYEHLHPHEHKYYARPDGMFEGVLDTTGEKRFEQAAK